MFSIEKISSGSQQTLLLYLSFLGILLFAATLLRLRIPLLRKAFVPASLLAGLIGLVLGPYVLRIIPADMMASIGGMPSNMIVIVFASMLLGLKKSGKPLRDSVKTVVPGVLQFYTYSFTQMGVGCLLCALFFTPLFGTNPLFGSTFEIGFAGGHGTAGGMMEVFRMLGWPEGGDVAKTTATIGLVAGIFGGMAIINFGVRKKYTRYLTKKMASDSVKEYFPEGERVSGSSVTISSDVVETFAFHAGLLGIAIFIGYEIVWIVKQVFSYSLPLFPFAMIGGWLLNLVIQRTRLQELTDREVISRIQGLSLELLVTSAVASISIPVVLSYWKPLLAGSAVILLVTAFLFFYTSPRIYPENWFEHGIVRYGSATGVAAIGFLLLRTADPQVKSDAFSTYAVCSTFFSPFVGGGLLTTAYPAIANGWGTLAAGIVFILLAAGLILFCFLAGFWVKHPRLQQRE